MPEIGSLRALANGESQFVGSSSGVYFINTVRRAFSTNAQATTDNNQSANTNAAELPDDPSPEACVVGDREVEPDSNSGTTNHVDPNPQSNEHFSPFSTGSDVINDVTNLPDYARARKLVLTYFRIWHPVVPFMQGPQCLAELDALYSSNSNIHEKQSITSISRLVTFKCIFNIAVLDSDDQHDLGSARFRSSSDLLPTLSLLALRSEASCIQALLSAQVYFVSVMSLRHASTVGGLISKSIYQSGMHRCPVRYGHLSSEERSMRKRIFWSFYVLDRFVSQSLGHPSGVQDSDIDVCPPGHRDLHEPVAESSPRSSSATADNTVLHLPANHPDRLVGSQARDDYGSASPTETEEDEANEEGRPEATDLVPNTRSIAIARHRRETQDVLQNHVRHSQLVGRILDVFHKSIHAREMNSQTILLLKADIAAWGNDITQPRFGAAVVDIPELSPDPAVFPFVTHHYTVLLLNRPSLSLDSRSAEFCAALQTCISAARVIIPTIENYYQNGGPLFWPGYMSAVWMSGLVLALAARLKSYNLSRAISGIHVTLKLLTAMETRWQMARDCKEVLSMLLSNIENTTKGQKRTRSDDQLESRIPTSPADDTRNGAAGREEAKRRMTRFSKRTERPRSPQTVQAVPTSRTRTPLTTSNHFNGTDGLRNNRVEQAGNSSFATPLLSSVSFNNHANYYQFSPTAAQTDPNGFTPSQDWDFQSSLSNMSGYFAPIPTIFPDRQRSATNQFGNGDNFFDIFDGATWGSLVDIINDAGGGT